MIIKTRITINPYTLSLNDSLKSSEKAVAIEKIGNAHEVEKKEITTITRVQKIQRMLSICSAVVLVIIGFLFYSRQKLIAEKRLALKTHRIRNGCARNRKR